MSECGISCSFIGPVKQSLLKQDDIYMYMICLDSNTDPNPVADNEIKANASRTRGKALDVYRVTTAHYGGPVIMNSVPTLINTVFSINLTYSKSK